ncbi:hypothetical protein BDK51DRAFT_38498, partial [Blyttiomyces helicus]
LVSRPEFIFGTPSGGHEEKTALESLAAGAALAGAILSAIAYCLVRKIGKRVHFMVHVTYFGFMSIIISGVGTLIGGAAIPVSDWTPVQWVILSGVGVAAFIAQCFLNAVRVVHADPNFHLPSQGLQIAPAGPATLMRNLDIVFAFVFGLYIFNEVPQVTSVIGALIILGATGAVAIIKSFKN